jgi:hypothetical protein
MFGPFLVGMRHNYLSTNFKDFNMAKKTETNVAPAAAEVAAQDDAGNLRQIPRRMAGLILRSIVQGVCRRYNISDHALTINGNALNALAKQAGQAEQVQIIRTARAIANYLCWTLTELPSISQIQTSTGRIQPRTFNNEVIGIHSLYEDQTVSEHDLSGLCGGVRSFNLRAEIDYLVKRLRTSALIEAHAIHSLSPDFKHSRTAQDAAGKTPVRGSAYATFSSAVLASRDPRLDKKVVESPFFAHRPEERALIDPNLTYGQFAARAAATAAAEGTRGFYEATAMRFLDGAKIDPQTFPLSEESARLHRGMIGRTFAGLVEEARQPQTPEALRKGTVVADDLNATLPHAKKT